MATSRKVLIVFLIVFLLRLLLSFAYDAGYADGQNAQKVYTNSDLISNPILSEGKENE